MLQVNHSPSFRCDTELDQNVKGRVIQGSMLICQAPHPAQAVAETGSVSGSALHEPYEAVCKQHDPLILEGYQWLGEWALPEECDLPDEQVID